MSNKRPMAWLICAGLTALAVSITACNEKKSKRSINPFKGVPPTTKADPAAAAATAPTGTTASTAATDPATAPTGATSTRDFSAELAKIDDVEVQFADQDILGVTVRQWQEKPNTTKCELPGTGTNPCHSLPYDTSAGDIIAAPTGGYDQTSLVAKAIKDDSVTTNSDKEMNYIYDYATENPSVDTANILFAATTPSDYAKVGTHIEAQVKGSLQVHLGMANVHFPQGAPAINLNNSEGPFAGLVDRAMRSPQELESGKTSATLALFVTKESESSKCLTATPACQGPEAKKVMGALKKVKGSAPLLIYEIILTDDPSTDYAAVLEQVTNQAEPKLVQGEPMLHMSFQVEHDASAIKLDTLRVTVDGADLLQSNNEVSMTGNRVTILDKDNAGSPSSQVKIYYELK